MVYQIVSINLKVKFNATGSKARQLSNVGTRGENKTGVS